MIFLRMLPANCSRKTPGVLPIFSKNSLKTLAMIYIRILRKILQESPKDCRGTHFSTRGTRDFSAYFPSLLKLSSTNSRRIYWMNSWRKPQKIFRKDPWTNSRQNIWKKSRSYTYKIHRTIYWTGILRGESLESSLNKLLEESFKEWQ